MAKTKKPTPTIEKVAPWKKNLHWLLFAIAFLFYANGINNGYNLDDQLVSRGNPLTSEGISNIGKIFTSPYYSDANGYSYGYRPIVHLSFALENSIFGESAKVGHLINVTLFAFTVFFLFKLLKNLFGEENLLYSFLACLLFALHPIHTEVVDSLKNRDEILALLFGVLLGIQWLKYLKNNKLKHFLWGFLFVLLAVMSKKSVYPVMVIYPIAFYLLFQPKWKILLTTTFIFSVPAAILASELDLSRLILLAFFPLLPPIVLASVFTKEFWIKNVKYHWIVSTALIALTIFMAFQLANFYLLFLLIPLFIWLLINKMEIGVLVLSVATFVISYRLGVRRMTDLSYLIPLGAFLFQLIYLKKKGYKSLVLALVLFAVDIFLNGIHPSQIFAMLILLAFIFLQKRFKWGGVIYLAIVIASYAAFSHGELQFKKFFIAGNLTFLLIALWLWMRQNKPIYLQSALVAIFTFTLIYAGTEAYNYRNPIFQQTSQIAYDASVPYKKPHKTIRNNGKNFLREGRDLEYVENPLIRPHTKSETVATGFYTLGTYFNLLIFPKDLSFYYGYAQIDIQQLTAPSVILAIIVHLLLVFLVLFYLRKNRLISIGFGWYLACIVLFSNWVELVAGVVGERLAFMASVGFFIGVVGLVKEFLPLEKNRQTVVIAFSVIGLLLGARTWVRNKDSKNEYTLMKHDIKHLKNSSQANVLYAITLMNEGSMNRNLTAEEQQIFFKAGVKHYERAIAIEPNYFNANFDLGRAYLYIKDTTGALRQFNRCLELDSTFIPAKKMIQNLGYQPKKKK